MRELRKLWVLMPAILLAALVAGWWMTRGAMEQLAFLRRNAASSQGVVDQRPAQTAETLASLAISSEEQKYAQQAERLADHEVDQAFAGAIREASLKPEKLTGEALATSLQVQGLKGAVEQDKTAVEQLTAAAAKSGAAPAAGDDLDVAKAQLSLDQDELADATGDLARESGDQRAQIQGELGQWQAAEKKIVAPTGQLAVQSSRRYGTLWGRAGAWMDQRHRAELLHTAAQQAADGAKSATTEHQRMEQVGIGLGSGLNGPGAATGPARVKLLERLGTLRMLMSLLDDRVATDEQLAAVYGRWESQVWEQHRILWHLLLGSLAQIALVLLAAAVAMVIGRMLLRRIGGDTRRVKTLDTIIDLGVYVMASVAILLVIFGPPEQMPTILGLAGAGLTVVFQDFILAFFGWFVLMGRNGIRAGDWVEINGVGGEVSEVGVFRTVLLETGNWTSRGHPTGRKVTFTNSYAIRGQYFNFTTHGQWMWDEIGVNVPADRHALELLAKMGDAVKAAAEADTEEATREWQAAAGEKGLGEFSAGPCVDMRPAETGVDLIARFVTRASDRFAIRAKLYAEMLRVVGENAAPRLETGPAQTTGAPVTENAVDG